jgi:hypothetical protein
MIVTVPPGIGDISWVYSKILDVAKKKKIAFIIESSPPPRSKPFVDLLPHIENLGYTPNGWSIPKHLPYNTDLSTLEDGYYKLFVNEWLEQGIKLADIFPNQSTHYHYDLKTSAEDKNQASIMADTWMQGYPKIGFYASNYHHGPMGFWDYPEWVDFLEQIRKIYPDVCFVAIGAEYDRKSILTYEQLKLKGFNVWSAIGTFNIGATIELIRKLNYFFAFPSGLGIMADVVDTPCTMWYWKGCTGAWGGCMDTFINSYADPKNVESKRHINLLYNTVSESIEYFKSHGMQWIK